MDRSALGTAVALLFTDIESSTKRWEDDQESMAAALAEHDRLLAGAAAELADALVRGAPGVRILATSREVLAVSGETVLRVDGLSLPSAAAHSAAEVVESDAVSLFCDRAAAAAPGFELTDANAAAIARICGRLDGIPLGIEIAVGRLRMLGVAQLAERLDSLALQAEGPRTADARHRTLTATIA